MCRVVSNGLYVKLIGYSYQFHFLLPRTERNVCIVSQRHNVNWIWLFFRLKNTEYFVFSNSLGFGLGTFHIATALNHNALIIIPRSFTPTHTYRTYLISYSYVPKNFCLLTSNHSPLLPPSLGPKDYLKMKTFSKASNLWLRGRGHHPWSLEGRVFSATAIRELTLRPIFWTAMWTDDFDKIPLGTFTFLLALLDQRDISSKGHIAPNFPYRCYPTCMVHLLALLNIGN